MVKLLSLDSFLLSLYAAHNEHFCYVFDLLVKYTRIRTSYALHEVCLIVAT